MKFLTNLTLEKKITLLTAIGLLLRVGVFSSLAMRAVNQATETTLEDRLTTVHPVVGQVLPVCALLRAGRGGVSLWGAVRSRMHRAHHGAASLEV